MLKNKLEIFVAKRIAVLFIILSVLDMIWIGRRWLVLAGLVLGTGFGLLRFVSTAASLYTIMIQSEKTADAFRSVAAYVIGLFAVVVLLVAAAVFNVWFFTGMVAGILLVPGVIFINALTEGLGITHNNFE